MFAVSSPRLFFLWAFNTLTWSLDSLSLRLIPLFALREIEMCGSEWEVVSVSLLWGDRIPLRGQETLCFLWDTLSPLHSHWFYGSPRYSCCFICATARAHIVNTTEQINRYKYNRSLAQINGPWMWCLGIIRCNLQNGCLFRLANKLTGYNDTFDLDKVLASANKQDRTSDLGTEGAEMDLLQRTLLADQIKPLEMHLDMNAEFHNDNCFRGSAKLLLFSVGGNSLCNPHINTSTKCYCFSRTLIVHDDPLYDIQVYISTT